MYYKCPKCGLYLRDRKYYKSCPNCGTRKFRIAEEHPITLEYSEINVILDDIETIIMPKFEQYAKLALYTFITVIFPFFYILKANVHLRAISANIGLLDQNFKLKSDQEKRRADIVEAIKKPKSRLIFALIGVLIELIVALIVWTVLM